MNCSSLPAEFHYSLWKSIRERIHNMKKHQLIVFATFVILTIALFVNKANASVSSLPTQENNFVSTISVFAVALQSHDVVLPPVEEEGSVFTNPFYIVSAFLLLMLVVEIVLFKRKRDKEKHNKSQGKGKYNSYTDMSVGSKKSKAKRYSQEEMSEILKASAVKGKSQVAQSTAGVQEGNQQQNHLHFTFELKQPEQVEELPQDVNDETFFDALADSQDEEAMIRIVAVRVLSKYKVSKSVQILSRAAIDDINDEVRLEAVEGLKSMGHVSAFAPLLIAVSDDNPNVKQVAIQAFTSLSFNMTDNYLRLIHSEDKELLKKVARACLVTGLVHKAFAQLVGQDQKQAYEGFALLSLLAKAGETKPLLDAITKHPMVDVRILAIKIMNDAHQPEAHEQLINVSESADLPSAVRNSILAAVGSNAMVN